MKLFWRIFFVLSMFSLIAVSCKKKSEEEIKVDNLADQKKLLTLADYYYDNYLKLNSFEATAQGDHRYDDILPDNISSQGIAKEIALYNDIIKKLTQINYKKLDDDHKVIYDVLDFQVKTKVEGFVYHPEYFPFNQFTGLPLEMPMNGSGEGIQPFKTKKDYNNWLKRLEQFPKWMDVAEDNFRSGISNNMVLPKVLVQKMITQMFSKDLITLDYNKNIFYGPVKRFPSNFSKEDRAHYTSLYQKAIKENIAPAYTKMGKFLQDEYLPKARDTDGYNALPKGDDIYNYYVRYWTTTTKNPDEIFRMGQLEVERVKNEMIEVKNELGFKGELPEFLASLKNEPKAMPYKTTKEVLDGFQAILEKISPKLKTMFNVVPITPFEIRRTEKYREATASAEYVPGTPDGKRPGIFYIPLPDPKKFNVTTGMESLFLHEAIPGHHYQVSLQQENKNLPRFMRFGWIAAYGEGWALYCELLGKELGLYTDPYQRLGALSDEMMRSVRLVVDTGLHTGKMNREEALKYFLDHVIYDKGMATAEIERYMAIPGQALSYKIGALNFSDLREKYEDSFGVSFNLASFHDELLSQGCLPIDVLNKKMDNWAKNQK